MSDVRANRGRVLVVDDDPTVRVLAVQALTSAGYEVAEAEDGRAALACLEVELPHLVLLDLQMPVLDGFDACRAIRAQDASREIPVLVATGLVDAQTIDRAFRAGASDFIEKPLDWQILQHRVRFLIRASRAFRDLTRIYSHLRASEGRLANAQRIARIGNWEWEPGSDRMLWSAEIYRMLGVEPRPGIASYQAFVGAVHPDDRETVEKALQQAAWEARPMEVEHRIRECGGVERVVQQQAVAEIGATGAVALVSGTIQDITERRRAEDQIRFLAYYDGLTALPNRKLLVESLERALANARRRGTSLAVLHLNLDRFKRINETLGHRWGDEILRGVGQRLVNCVRPTDRVGRPAGGASALPVSRVGGDEFSIVLSDLRDSEEATHVARRVLEDLRSPFSLEGQSVVMGASIGIAVFPGDGDDAESLLGSANVALHHAKSAGRGIYQFFSASMNERAMRSLRLESCLRDALDRGAFELHFQPQLDTRSGEVTKAEALLRWPSCELGPVTPGEFIPLAEETGLIGPLGEWVLRAACAQVREWDRAGLPRLRVAVNVSSQQLRDPRLLASVQRILSESGVEADQLELELTESALFSEETAVLENLEGLKRLGLRIALDDFGTGYSSLSHLVRFAIDTLKIDRSFVQDAGDGGRGNAIVSAVMAMARRLGLSVVAEGVETREQAAYLRSEGCDFLQGFHLGRPVPAEAFAACLTGRA